MKQARTLPLVVVSLFSVGVTEAVAKDWVSHRVVKTVTQSPAKKVLTQARYEYFEAIRKSGDHFTKRMITDIDGEKTETVFDDACGSPSEIARDGEKTTLKYDGDCHVIEKKSPSEWTKLDYDSTWKKVKRVAHKDLKSGKELDWATYDYDNRGNLKEAKNSEGKSVKLAYESGRIGGMVNEKGHKILFKYNENDQPKQIIDPEKGTINVEYDNTGEIKNIQSEAGHEIAVKVTEEFEELLKIVGPAGVSLGMGD